MPGNGGTMTKWWKNSNRYSERGNRHPSRGRCVGGSLLVEGSLHLLPCHLGRSRSTGN